MKTVILSVFKGNCIALLREAQRTVGPVIVTRRGRPPARIEPVREPTLARGDGLPSNRGCRPAASHAGSKIAIEAYKLPRRFHKDPADRLLVATARLRDLTLVTADERILAYPSVRMLDARA